MKVSVRISVMLISCFSFINLYAMNSDRQAFLDHGEEIKDHARDLKERGYSESCLYVSGITVDEDQLSDVVEKYLDQENVYRIRLEKMTISPPIKNALKRTKISGEVTGKIPGTDLSVTITASHVTLLGIGEDWLDRVSFALKQESSEMERSEPGNQKTLLIHNIRFSDIYNKETGPRYEIPSTGKYVQYYIRRCSYSTKG